MTRESQYQALLNTPNGSALYRIDLHIHTPASKDHKWGAVQPRDIVRAIIDKQLDVVAITDHFSGEWIDKIKDACQSHRRDNRNNDRIPVILPGVEVSVGGIHLTLVFSEDKDTSYIHNVLARLKVPLEMYGDPAYVLTLGIVDTVKIAKSLGALVIGAHCHSEKGIIGGLEGLSRMQALEAIDFLELHHARNREQNLKTVHYVRNNLACMNIPFITSSDAHVADELFEGCLVKMAKPDFRGLQQIIYEPNLRLFQDKDPSTPDVLVIGVAVDGSGVYDKMILNLNTGLNVVIGGRGAGKSALLDTIRFALGDAPRSEELSERIGGHFHRISGLHRESTIIRVYYSIHSEIYCTERTVSINATKEKVVKYSANHKSRKYRSVDNQFIEQDEALPVSFEILSQGEVQSLIEKSQQLVGFLDRYDSSIDIHKIAAVGYKEKCQELEEKILQTQTQLNEIEAIRSQKQVLIERQNQLAEILSSDEYIAFQQVSNLDGSLNPIYQNTQNLLQALNPVEEKITMLDTRLKKVASNTSAIIVDFLTASQTLVEETSNAINKLRYFVTQSNSKFNIWRTHFNTVTQDFNNHLDSTSRSGQRDLVQQKNDIDTRLIKTNEQLELLAQLENNLKSLHIEFDKCVQDLIAEQSNIAATRLSVIKDLNEKLSGRIRLQLRIGEDSATLYDVLDKLLSGSRITPKESTISKLVARFSGSELYKLIFDRDTTPLLQLIGQANASKVMALFNDVGVYSLAYTVNDDIPEVFLHKAGEDRPLAELSHGEKVSALLPILMLENRSPLLIDQPEDDLDHAFITENIVEAIRSSRGSRQVLVITHNPNIPVLGDADLIIKVERREAEKRCEIVSAEGLETESSMNALKLLEGGQEAFERRSQKYKAAS